MFTPQQRAAAAKVGEPRSRREDNLREANAARRLLRLVPMVRRSDETRGDGKGARASRPTFALVEPFVRSTSTWDLCTPVTRRWYRLVGRSYDIGRRRTAGAAGEDVAATDETREGGPGAIAAVRHAVLRHTMRACRARMVELCAEPCAPGRG